MRYLFLLITAFLLGTSFPALLLPQSGSGGVYVLGPGDRITVNVRDLKEIDIRPATIDRDGTVELQYAGRLKAVGLTTEQLSEEIQKRLANIIRQPRITVEVAEYGSQPVLILGAVNKPGVHQLRGGKNLVEVLALAEGMKPEAGNVIKITRRKESGLIPLTSARQDISGQFSTAEVGLKALLEARTSEANIQIRPNDVIAIARADLIYVMGNVRKPGGFPLAERESLTVLQAIALAEGVQPGSAPQHSKILRSSNGDVKSQEIVIDVKRIIANQSLDQHLEPNDILYIPSSAAKSASFRILETGLQMATGLVIFRR